MGDSPFAISVQAVGTLMVAALLWQLTRLIPCRFLRFWSGAWVALTWALFALRITKANHIPEDLRPLGFSCYLLGEYLFGFLLWAGFRDYAKDRPITFRDTRVLWLLVAVAIVLPWLLAEAMILPLHTVVMSGFFAASFMMSWAVQRRDPRPPVGLNIVRVLLAGLTVTFFLFGPLLAWSRFVESVDGQYFRLHLVYYALIELGLAFGLVVIAAERAQEMLEEKNQMLSDASRRDALTGLYNRRHFDELLADHTGSGAVAVIDVNDLKLINDRHLHAAGDAVLKLVARSLVSRFRVSDPAFRIGGDEFVLVMIGGTENDLAARMADVDDSLMNLRIPGVKEPTDIRVAWGVAPYAIGGLATAFDAADKAMYACKQRRKTKHDTA